MEKEMSLGEKFLAICIETYGSCSTSVDKKPPEPVSDEFVATIIIENGTCRFGEDCLYNYEKPRDKQKCEAIKNENLQTICLVLESPHINEYDSGEPLGPALSTTGKNIAAHLRDVLNEAIKGSIIKLQDGTYALVLVEAISFQCSNGCDLAECSNKSKRNCVFSELWGNGGKEDFIARINDLDPSLIINSCTGGLRNKDDVDFLNGKINDALNEYDRSAVNTSHPSSYWFWKKGIN